MPDGTIRDVPGLYAGHAHDDVALTGCTVVLIPGGAIAGVDVRGGAPGTRETDLLDPANTVDSIHGLCLSGGSAFGLDAATGVMRYLYEQGIGFAVGSVRVPIVPAAVIFDLGLGKPDRWPDAAMGYTACESAMQQEPPLAEGNAGAGMGASVGKIMGMGNAMKAGIGTASRSFADYYVGALVVTNAFGDVVDRAGTIIAGARDLYSGSFADTVQVLSALPDLRAPAGANTTLAVVATDMPLTKSDCTRVARMAHDAFARAIRPVHTSLDGDTIFVLSTGGRPATPPDAVRLAALGAVAVETLVDAIERSVRLAAGAGGLPGLADSHA